MGQMQYMDGMFVAHNGQKVVSCMSSKLKVLFDHNNSCHKVSSVNIIFSVLFSIELIL